MSTRVSDFSALNTMPIKTVRSANFYDPIEHLEELLVSPKLRADALRQWAWYVDRQIVSTAYGLFYDMWEEAKDTGSVDSFAEFATYMHEKTNRETNLVEQGFMSTGGVTRLQQLLIYRDEAHDAAETLIGDRYKRPEVEQMLLDEQPRRVDALSKTKLRKLAEAEANGDKELEEAMFAQLIARRVARNKDAHERRLELVPIVVGLLQFIGARAPDEARFYDLPIDTQKRMVEQLVAIIKRSTSSMADARDVDEFDFCVMMREGKAAIAAIEQVLKHPLFSSRDDEPMGARQLDAERERATGHVDVGPVEPIERNVGLTLSNGATVN